MKKSFLKLLLAVLILAVTDTNAAIFTGAHSSSQRDIQQNQPIQANGAMYCDLSIDNNNVFYCLEKDIKWNRKSITIQNFFEKYKPNLSCKLSGISVNHYSNEIFIYFIC